MGLRYMFELILEARIMNQTLFKIAKDRGIIFESNEVLRNFIGNTKLSMMDAVSAICSRSSILYSCSTDDFSINNHLLVIPSVPLTNVNAEFRKLSNAVLASLRLERVSHNGCCHKFQEEPTAFPPKFKMAAAQTT
jgi:hypothetical protein